MLQFEIRLVNPYVISSKVRLQPGCFIVQLFFSTSFLISQGVGVPPCLLIYITIHRSSTHGCNLTCFVMICNHNIQIPLDTQRSYINIIMCIIRDILLLLVSYMCTCFVFVIKILLKINLSDSFSRLFQHNLLRTFFFSSPFILSVQT